MLRMIGAFGLLLSVSAWAQVASVTGRVTNQTGAVVPQAAVSARALQTGVVTKTETNPDGYYTLPALPPGSYDHACTAKQRDQEVVCPHAEIRG